MTIMMPLVMCADTLTRAERSERMSLIRSKDTKPERVVRRIVTSLGGRYRLNYAKVAGKPDLAFPGRRKVIWVHGCFWHRHEGCGLARLPKSRLDFWEPKLEANRRRDESNTAAAQAEGWEVMVVWECQTRDLEGLRARLAEFLIEPGTVHKKHKNL